MDQDFQEDEDQEQQSQQAESGSNLNDASLNQEDDPNQNNQLEISKDKKQIKRICMFPIKKEWKSERQIFLAFCILSIVVLCVVCGVILGNMNIATYLIEQSAQKESEITIQNTLENSVLTSANLYKEVFFRYSISLKIINRIFLSSLKLDDSFYDDPAYSTFPIIGPQKYISIKQSIPVLTDRDKELQKYYQMNQVSLDYISYFSFTNKDDWAQITNLGQIYLTGADILNYYLKNMVYFRGTLTRIQQLYLSLSDQIQIFYPAGSCTKLLKYQGQDLQVQNRIWYKKAVENYTLNKKLTYVITGPYKDLATGLPIITISRPIITKDNNIIGVIGIDLLSTEIDKIIPIPQLYTRGKFFLANLNDGYLLNDPCSIRSKDPYNTDIPSYRVDNTAITNFTSSNWDLIKNLQYKNGTFFELLNANNEKIIIYRQSISISDQAPELILFAAIPHDEGYDEYNSIQDTLKINFHMRQYYVIITASSITVFSLICSFYFVKTIVSPLQELADCTKEFTNQEKKSNSSEMKKKKQFDDIKTSDSDIGQLIIAFKKLIKDLSGFKKGTRKDNQQQSEDYVEYPKGDGMESGLQKQNRFLQNYEEFEDKLNHYIDNLEKLSNANKNKEFELQETEYQNSSQNESYNNNQDMFFYKIEASFLKFIEIVLNSIEQEINEQIHKGQNPQIGKEDMRIFLAIKNFYNQLIACIKHIVIYDKFRSQYNQNTQDYDEQDQDQVQEEEFSNLPEENLFIYDRKTSMKIFEEIILKFKQIEQIIVQLVQKTYEKKNTLFLNELLPNEIVD